MTSMVNKPVLDRMVDSESCIVCTAAPLAYVFRMSLGADVPFIRSLDHQKDSPGTANVAAGKVENLKACFRGKCIRVVNFFTDSSTDDRALIDLSVNAFIVKYGLITHTK